jgi:hypothetical protein
MLTSAYSPAVLTAHPKIKVIEGFNYSLGADYLTLNITATNLKLNIAVSYVLPMASSTGVFGQDQGTQLLFSIEIKGSQLYEVTSQNLSALDWQPAVSFVASDLHIYNLPQGLVEISVLNATQTATDFWAYFQTGNQLPGLAQVVTPEELNYALYQAAASNNFSLQTSCVSAITKLILQEYGLPLRQLRFVGKSLPIPALPAADIASNSICALYLLKILHNWRAAPYAQQLDTNLESDLINALKILAGSSKSALDLRTGLVFANKDRQIYSNPSSITTAVNLIVWHELVNSYQQDEFLLPLVTAWSFWEQRQFNPSIESNLEYDLATRLLDTYLSTEVTTYINQGIGTLFDCSSLATRYLPLIAYLPNITIAPASLLPKILTLPRTANKYLAASSAQMQNAYAIFLQVQLVLMPYGYLWPTAQTLSLQSSIWRAFFRATAAALAYSWMLQLFKNRTDPWHRVLWPPTPVTPSGYWQELTQNYYQVLKLGPALVEGTAYHAGLVPITTSLQDYQFTQFPPALTPINYPELATLDAQDPQAYTAGLSPDLYPGAAVTVATIATQEAVYLDSLLSFSDLDRPADSELHPLNLTTRTNWLALSGEGKPQPIVAALKQRVPAYATCFVYFHTWDITPAVNLKFDFNEITGILPLVGVVLDTPVVGVVLDVPIVGVELQPLTGFGPVLTASPDTAIEGNADDLLVSFGTGDPAYAYLLQPLFFGTNSSRIVTSGAGLEFELTGTPALPTLNWYSATQNPDLILLSNPPIAQLNQTITTPDYYNRRYFRAGAAEIQAYMLALNLRYLVAANYLVANPANQGISAVPPGDALICLQRGNFSTPNFGATTSGLFGESLDYAIAGGNVYAGDHHLGWSNPSYNPISSTKYVYGFYIQIDMLNPSSTWFVNHDLKDIGGK